MGLAGRWAVISGLVLPMVLLIGNMVRVQSYTVDDAYISYRYARNFARGHGLVYNVGEYVEGYTNFLWTILLAAGFWLRLNPDVVAKGLGGLAACGSLWIVYRLSRRVRPYGMTPCIATWLMASSMVQTGYAVFGMETSFFVFLILAGVDLFFRERDRGRGFPYSGLVFGLAGLTRPEAPMFFGLTILFLGRRLLERQNLLRGLLFVAILGGHELWRYSYYGAWLPQTVIAKTSTESLRLQLINGAKYLLEYIGHAWVPFALAALGLCVVGAWVLSHWRGAQQNEHGRMRPFDGVALAVLALASAAYVVSVGGDWMPFFRFLAPVEPFYFVIACVGVRALADPFVSVLSASGRRLATRRRVIATAVCVLAAVVGVTAFRGQRLMAAQQQILMNDKIFWESAAGQTASFLTIERLPGKVAVWDIGFVGYATDYPLFDLFGLVTPATSDLPGGYSRRYTPEWVNRVLGATPDYFVLVGKRGEGCTALAGATEQLRTDRRFQDAYKLGAMIQHTRGGHWCFFEKREGLPARLQASPQLGHRYPVLPTEPGMAPQQIGRR